MHLLPLARHCSRHPFSPRSPPTRTLSTTSAPPPLRILFLGSDDFSAASLRALHREHISNSALINSIDVLCPPDQRSGRDLRVLKEVPLKPLARSLSLPLHETPTLKNWNLPPTLQINLLIAVSFGHLIPAHLTTSPQYGGINVHPSLLPMYRGAAPIHHTLLDQTPITGATIQTLHPTKFDHGHILLQTTPPIQIPPKTTYKSLHDALAVHAADLLIETCRRRLFAPPINPVTNGYSPSLAPKVDAGYEKIDWKLHDAGEVERRCAVFGKVWCRLVTLEEPELERRVRVVFQDVVAVDCGEGEGIVVPGSFEYRYDGVGSESLVVKCKEGGGWIRVGAIKIEGRRLVHGGEWARSIAGQKGKKARRIFQ